MCTFARDEGPQGDPFRLSAVFFHTYLFKLLSKSHLPQIQLKSVHILFALLYTHKAQEAVKAALADGATLVEVEFPSTSLSSVSGDFGWGTESFEEGWGWGNGGYGTG